MNATQRPDDPSASLNAANVQTETDVVAASQQGERKV